jgi:hypothetical protein
LETEAVDLKAKLEAVETLNSKLSKAVEKLISLQGKVASVPLSPSVSSSFPSKAPTLSWSPFPASSLSSPSSLSSSSSSSSSPSSSPSPLTQPLSIKVESPSPLQIGQKRGREDEDPTTVSRDLLTTQVAGKDFTADFLQYCNSVKKEMKEVEIEGKPLEAVRKLYTLAKDEIAAKVPKGESHFEYGCKFIHTLYHSCKKEKKSSEGLESSGLGGMDIEEAMKAVDEAPGKAQQAPSAVTPNTAAPTDTGKKDWKALTVNNMGVPAPGADKMNLEAAQSAGKKTSLSDAEALGLSQRLVQLKDPEWLKYLMRDKHMFVRFALANDARISYSEAASRLLKILVRVPLHDAFATQSTEKMKDLVDSVPGSTLDEKIEALVTKEEVQKKQLAVFLTLFELTGKRIIQVLKLEVKEQALVHTAVTKAIEDNLQAPTRSNPVEKIFHVLLTSTMAGKLEELKPLSVNILGAMFQMEANTVMTKVCPDGVIPGTFKAVKLLTF